MKGAQGYQIWRQEDDGAFRIVKIIGAREEEQALGQCEETAYSNTGLEAGKEYDVDVVIDTFVIPDLTFTLVLSEDADDSLDKLYAVWTLSNSEGEVFKVDWENAFVLNRTENNDFKLLIDADNLTGNHDRLDIGEWTLNITVADTNDTDAQKMVGSGDIKVNIIPAGDPVEEDVEISLSE